MRLLLIMTLAIGLSTFAGAVSGLFIRKIPHRFHDAILSFAAGIMLAAAVFGLILPAVHCRLPFSVFLTVAGLFCGALLVSLLDRLTPHLHRLAGVDPEEHRHNQGFSKVLLFIAAIALHKFPEGLAAGVTFGTNDPGDMMMVGVSISLQNIPEAMVIVAPLMTVGVSIRRTLLISAGIGLISMAGTMSGAALSALTARALPFLLSLAGGTMLYVISDEMIPETHAHGNEKLSTFSLIAGFTVILILQPLFG